MEPLIPGLPNDIARECLFRIHYTQLSTVCSVSKAWRSLLLSGEFRRRRDQHCSQLILLSSLVEDTRKLIVFELEKNIWSELPPCPDFPNGWPFSYLTIASFRWGFVVLVVTTRSRFCYKVYIFDYLSATWQRGADVPTRNLYVQITTSDRDRIVYVLLDDGSCNTQRIMVYDVMKDKWISVINIKEDTFHMVYQSGKIHMYGMDIYSKNVLNVSTWEWEPPQVDFQGETILTIFLNEDDGEWYSFDENDGTLAIYKDFCWKAILKTKMLTRFWCSAMWKSKALLHREECTRTVEVVEGSRSIKWEIKVKKAACVMDLKNHKFTIISVPTDLRGDLRTDCYLEI